MGIIDTWFKKPKEEIYHVPVGKPSCSKNFRYIIRIEQIIVPENEKTSSKKWIYILLLLLLLILISGVTTALISLMTGGEKYGASGMSSTVTVDYTTTPRPTFAKNTTVGSRGKAFLVLFMANIVTTRKLVYVTSENGTDLNITTSSTLDPSLKSQIDRSINVPSNQKIVLPSNIELISFRKEKKSVIFESSHDVFVISHDSTSATTGSTTHIPIHQLSTKYIAISTWPTSTWKSQLAVAAIEDNTTISITFNMNTPLYIEGDVFRKGDTFNLTLDSYETYQIAHVADLTGTIIESTAPIAAFSGNDCNKLGNIGACDHLIEQLPPIEAVDNTYIVPPHSNDRNTIVRITASEDTNSTYMIGGSSRTLFLNEAETFDTRITTSQTCSIYSENPVLVTSFGLSSTSSDMGDPSMTIVPGINQYLDYYKIVVPTGYVDNFVSIMIDASSRDSIRINGLSINPSSLIFQKNVLIGNITFSVRSIKVSEGELTASSVQNQRFGLMFSGTRDFDAYGFSGNSLLINV